MFPGTCQEEIVLPLPQVVKQFKQRSQAKAEMIVTGNKHFLAPERYQDIAILRLADFLATLQE